MNVDLMTGGDLSKHMCIDDDRLILIKGKIPIVRFNTVESSERDRLIEALIKTTEQQTVLA